MRKFSRIPSGWYCAMTSEELPAGKISCLSLHDKSLVIYRTFKSKEVYAVQAYCPHLGAHFGFGGKVVNDLLVCPFHKIAYQTNGKSKNAIANSFSGLCLTHYPVQEKNGMIYVYYPTEKNKLFDYIIPDIDSVGWIRTKSRSWEFTSSFIETCSNIADIQHLKSLHNFDKILNIKAPILQDKQIIYSFSVMKFLKFPYSLFTKTLLGDFKTVLYAPGVGLTQVTIPDLGIIVRWFGLTLPLENFKIKIRFILEIKPLESIKEKTSLQKFLHTRIGLSLALFLYKKYIHFALSQDLHIFEKIHHLDNPTYTPEDVYISSYIAWLENF